jgi:tetratricopeptide (TPR) repeat protein
MVEKPPTLRRIDGKTAEFVARIAREQTLRVGRSEAALQDAADEARSCRQGIRGLVDAGMFQPALQMLRAWKATPGEARGEREYLLGYCMQALRQDKATALRHYAAALESGFDEFWVRYNRGQLLLSCGDYASGIADLERACFLRPDDCGAKGAFEYWAAQDSAKDASVLNCAAAPAQRWSI